MSIVLAAITDKLELVTSAAASVDVNVTYVDGSNAPELISVARKQDTAIGIAATTSILASCTAGTSRNVKQLTIRNNDALLSNDVTLRLSQNDTISELHKQTLAPGETLVYIEGLGFKLSDVRAIATAKSRSVPVDTEDTTTYRKTDKGTREVADRALGLEKHVRRLLIMIDGNRVVAELSVYVRPGELKSTLARLVAEGFIEMLSAGERIPGRVTYAPVASDPIVFAGIKVRAMAEIHDRLGSVSNLLVSEINSCSNPLELREKLRSLESALVHLLGATEGVTLARKIGGELTKLIPQTPAE